MKLINERIQQVLSQDCPVTNVLDGEFLFKHYILTEEQIEKIILYYNNKINFKEHRLTWRLISSRQKLSISFIEKYIENIDIDVVLCNQKINEDFVLKWEKIFANEHWIRISRIVSKKFSRDFYIKFYDKLDLDFLYTHQKVIKEELYDQLIIMKELSK